MSFQRRIDAAADTVIAGARVEIADKTVKLSLPVSAARILCLYHGVRNLMVSTNISIPGSLNKCIGTA